MDNETLFSDEDEKKEKDKQKEEKFEDTLELEDEDDDIIPIEETGGSGRKILWTIVVLAIIGLGIYSFAKREQIRESLKSEGTTQEVGEATETSLEKFTLDSKDSNSEDVTVNSDDQKIAQDSTLPEFQENATQPDSTTKTQTNQNQAGSEDKPAIQKVDDNFVAAAQKGEGITNLARRALQEQLTSTGREGEVTNEQKIYVEDYLRKKIGSTKLAIGETKTFSADLINEAINASKKLDEKQLKNLEKYSKIVFGTSGSAN